MRLAAPLLIVITLLIFMSCANQGSPTGGPLDTIPPVLIKSKPKDKSINYHEKEFQLIFNERINADKIKQNLIITPLIDNPYTYRVKKNVLTLTFENDFDSLTTYTLNFAAGVTDATEKTSAENLKIAFSTGPTIDSLSLSGRVQDLYKNDSLENVLVALFLASDSLNILTGKPRYFTTTDEEGSFTFDNIKQGYYKIYAFDDDNDNQINEPGDESHGFIADSIHIDSLITDLLIRNQVLDISPLEFNRAKFTGTYFDIEYGKFITEYVLREYYNPNQLNIPAHNLVQENTTIRMYYDSTFRYEEDSLGFIIEAYDSLTNFSLDTIYTKFRASKRKTDLFTAELLPKNSSNINPQFTVKLRFNKPIKYYNYDSIRLQYDTLFYQFLPDSSFSWNLNMTQLQIPLDLDPDWFKKQTDSLLQFYADTTITDTIYIAKRKYLKQIDTLSVHFIVPEAAFISVEQDSTEAFSRRYQFKNPLDYGSVSGTVTTDYPNFILQLVSPSYDVIQSIYNPTTYSFKNVPPGKYTFRILLDEDADGQWFYGNLLKNQEPEPIYFYPETFDLRANWQLENIDIVF